MVFGMSTWNSTCEFFENENLDMLYQYMKKKLTTVDKKEDIDRSRNIIETKYSLKSWVQKVIKEYEIIWEGKNGN